MTKIYDRFDAATRNTSCVAIICNGEPVGRVVLKFGNAVTAYVQAWGFEMQAGRAGGGGYDRASAAVAAAAAKLTAGDDAQDRKGARILGELREALLERAAGGTGWERRLEDAGFTIARVI